MRSGTFSVRSKAALPHYTYLRACISEADEGYLLQVTLCDTARHDLAQGEKMADTFEEASAWLGALAAEHSIAADRIEIELRMNNPTEGTRH